MCWQKWGMKTTLYLSQRRQFWKQHIANHAGGGQSVREYCQQHRISKYSFYEWRNRLLKENPDDTQSPEPVKRFAVIDGVQLSPQPCLPIQVVLRTGERIEIAMGADAATLGMVIGLLRTPPEAR